MRATGMGHDIMPPPVRLACRVASGIIAYLESTQLDFRPSARAEVADKPLLPPGGIVKLTVIPKK